MRIPCSDTAHRSRFVIVCTHLAILDQARQVVSQSRLILHRGSLLWLRLPLKLCTCALYHARAIQRNYVLLHITDPVSPTCLTAFPLASSLGPSLPPPLLLPDSSTAPPSPPPSPSPPDSTKP